MKTVVIMTSHQKHLDRSYFGNCAMCGSESAYLLVELRQLGLGSILDRHVEVCLGVECGGLQKVRMQWNVVEVAEGLQCVQYVGRSRNVEPGDCGMEEVGSSSLNTSPPFTSQPERSSCTPIRQNRVRLSCVATKPDPGWR
jgi:hypothetical protein